MFSHRRGLGRTQGGRGSPRLPVTSAPSEKRGANNNDWEYRADPVKRQYQIIYTHDASGLSCPG